MGASSVPDSVETRLVFGGVQLLLELVGDDWKRMQDIGLGPHPDLVAALAWRRCGGTEWVQKRLPTVQLVSPEALDIPKHSRPTTWEGLVQHVEKGGYFRTVGVWRYGSCSGAAATCQRRFQWASGLGRYLPVPGPCQGWGCDPAG